MPHLAGAVTFVTSKPLIAEAATTETTDGMRSAAQRRLAAHSDQALARCTQVACHKLAGRSMPTDGPGGTHRP